MRSSDSAKSSGCVGRLDNASPREKGKSPGQHEEEEEEEEEEGIRGVLKAGESLSSRCSAPTKKNKKPLCSYSGTLVGPLVWNFGCWATETDNQPTRLVDGSDFFKRNVRTKKEPATFEPWKSIRKDSKRNVSSVVKLSQDN